MWLKLGVIVAAILAVWGIGYAVQQHERKIGALQCEARVSARYEQDVASAAQTSALIAAQRDSARHEADTLRAQAAADRASAPAADARLRNTASALLARCLPQHPTAGGVGQTGASSPDLSAELQRRIDALRRDIRSVADFADADYPAHIECAGAYPVKD